VLNRQAALRHFSLLSFQTFPDRFVKRKRKSHNTLKLKNGPHIPQDKPVHLAAQLLREQGGCFPCCPPPLGFEGRGCIPRNHHLWPTSITAKHTTAGMQQSSRGGLPPLPACTKHLWTPSTLLFSFYSSPPPGICYWIGTASCCCASGPS
jgi:hypothetical protein